MKIFINYRREDEANMAFAIANALMKEFGVENVFFDRQAIQAGSVFTKEIDKALEKCRIFIPIIGKEWLSIMKKRQALDEKDYVLEEIGHAMKRQGMIVVPVLVDDTIMPSEKDLPPEASGLSLINAVNISSDPKRLPMDVKLLINEIWEVKPQPKPKPGLIKFLLVLGAVAIVIFGYLWIGNPFKQAKEKGNISKDDSVLVDPVKTSSSIETDAVNPAIPDKIEESTSSSRKEPESNTSIQKNTSEIADKNVNPKDLQARIDELSIILANQLEKRTFDKANSTIEEILALDRDNIDALNAQALLDKQQGFGNIKNFKGPGTVSDAIFFQNGQKIIAVFNGITGKSSMAKPPTVIIWNVETEQKLFEFAFKTGWKPTCMDLSPNEQTVLLGDLFNIYLFNIKTNETLASYKATLTQCVSFLPEGNRAVSGGSELLLWDFELGSVIHRFKGHEGKIQSLAVTPDGKKAVTGGEDATIRLWDLQKKSEVWSADGFKVHMQCIAISPDGKQILAGGNKIIRLLDLNTGKEILKFAAHKGYTLSIAFSPDGRRALSGGTDNILRYWDLEKGVQLRGYEVSGEWTSSVGFSPNGHYAFSSDISNVSIWILPK